MLTSSLQMEHCVFVTVTRPVLTLVSGFLAAEDCFCILHSLCSHSMRLVTADRCALLRRRLMSCFSTLSDSLSRVEYTDLFHASQRLLDPCRWMKETGDGRAVRPLPGWMQIALSDWQRNRPSCHPSCV